MIGRIVDVRVDYEAEICQRMTIDLAAMTRHCRPERVGDLPLWRAAALTWRAAASAWTRFGVYHAGVASAENPAATIEPQRASTAAGQP